MKRILLICLTALFCVPASAMADSGSILGITPAGDEFLGSYSVSVTVPDSVRYYGGYGYAWQVAPSEVCDPYDYLGRLVWVGEVMDGNMPDTSTGSDTFYPNGASFKICLGISRAETGRKLVAEQVYNPPATVSVPAQRPAPTPVPVSVPAETGAPASTTAPVNDAGKAATCTYWTMQESKRGGIKNSAKAAYSKAKQSYRKKPTAARRGAINRARQRFNVAASSLKTAESKALAACT
jgi:hypothetical protein